MRFGRLEAIVFVAGFSVLVVEIVGARLLAPYLGNTLFTWTSAIAVVLAALSIGYHYGGRLSENGPSMRALSAMLIASGLLVGALPLVSDSVLGLSVMLGYEYGPIFACLALFALPNFCLGMVSPYAVRLKSRSLRTVGESAGDLYAVSTAGSIAGALLSGYILVPWIGIDQSFFATCALLLVVGVAVFGRKGLPLLLAAVAFPLVGAAIAPAHGPSVLFVTDTPYYHLTVTNSSGMIGLQTDLTLQTVVSEANRSGVLPYYEYQKLVYNSEPVSRALFLGLGGGAMVMDLYRSTNASIDVVEIDPVVIQVARRFFNLTDSRRVTIYNQDARYFLRDTTGSYNMIVMDVWGSSLSLPYQLATQEAAMEMKSHLAPNGSVLINFASPLEGSGSGPFKSLYATFGSVFPNMYVFPQYPQNITAMQNIVMIASSDRQRWTEAEMLRALNATRNSSAAAAVDLRIVSDNGTQQGAGRVMLLDNGTYYGGTAGYPILTDNRNPFEVYEAEAIASVHGGNA